MEVLKTIDKYTINCLVSTLLERKLYVATDPEGRNVVLKESIINQHEQLAHEYEMLAKLNNPYIIKPIELIEFENKYYLVLPRAETDLSDFMKSEVMSDQLIHQIMHNLLSAVQYLNVLGIWHRNINPQNILVFKDDQNYRFVLADFKLAINYTGTCNEDFRATLQYMAPEISENKECMFFNYFLIQNSKEIQKVYLNFFEF